MWNEMYQKGYDNAVISFAYIPDFKNEKEKKEFERGLKDGYKTIKKKNKKETCKIFNSGGRKCLKIMNI